MNTLNCRKRNPDCVAIQIEFNTKSGDLIKFLNDNNVIFTSAVRTDKTWALNGAYRGFKIVPFHMSFDESDYLVYDGISLKSYSEESFHTLFEVE